MKAISLFVCVLFLPTSAFALQCEEIHTQTDRSNHCINYTASKTGPTAMNLAVITNTMSQQRISNHNLGQIVFNGEIMDCRNMSAPQFLLSYKLPHETDICNGKNCRTVRFE